MHYSSSFIDYCTKLELKFTSMRKEVLFILWGAEKPLKAYEILDSLSKIKVNTQPPSVYRALDFFVANGVVHKIESIQCYTLCCEPLKHLYAEVLMVCNQCHQVTEICDPQVQEMVLKLTNDNGFTFQQDIIELKGICQRCSSSEACPTGIGPALCI
jgi:Fur family zinc uptake transcriptional regulator